MTTRPSSRRGDVSIVVRRLPLFRPTVSSITVGMPKARPPTRPPLSRNTDRWKRPTSRAAVSLMAITPGPYAPSKNSVVATIVFVHAHPDDEAIFTAGTMCLLSSAGHRVVLVVATGGELGIPHQDAAGPGHLAVVRRDETAAAAALLGVDRTEFLGYH